MRRRALLTLAAVAVAFAAADTYVVVLALPDMMLTVGLGIDELQRAAPIVSGFLLGYVAMLPLIGRIADIRGRVPVLVASLVVFAFGSLVTALAFDLPSVVTGRFLQGVGGGGLVPATLALVADLYPAERRAVPLGVVSAVQEVGSVIGPLYGAVVLAVADWEAIFWLNLAVGPGARRRTHPARHAEGARAARRATATCRRPARRCCSSWSPWSALVLLLWEPATLVSDITLGMPFVPVAGETRWLTPLALLARAVRGRARGPLPRRRAAAGRPARLGRQLPAGRPARGDAAGGGAGRRDPRLRHRRPRGAGVLADRGLAAGRLGAGRRWRSVWHLRRADAPADPAAARSVQRPAWGSLVVSFFVGASLIAALVDIPVYARLTTYKTSQLMAALVLLRLLVAIPIGAVAGGFLTRRLPAGVVCAGGMALADGRLRVDVALGRALAGEPADQRPAGARRARLRAGAGTGQRRPARQHRRPPCTAWSARWSWSPGWSACWSGSPR